MGRASAENAQEVYRVVYGKLKEMLVGVAPDRVMKVVGRPRDALRELEELV